MFAYDWLTANEKGRFHYMQSDARPAPPPMVPTVPSAMADENSGKSSSGVRWLFVGGTGLFVLVLLCGGGLYWFYTSSQAEVEQAVNAFQARLDAEDYEVAYQAIGPEWKLLNSQADFTELESTIFSQLGKLQSKTMLSFNVNEATSGSTAYFIYNCTFEHGQGQVKYSLTKSTGAWRIVGHHVESPALLKVLACPSCSKVMNEFAKFCGECGAKMNR